MKEKITESPKIRHLHEAGLIAAETSETHKNGTPKSTLSLTDAIAFIVGIVIGAGIFRSPSLVAANTENELVFLSAWVLGGLVSIIGALCYAELTTAFPNTGGDYHFLYRAFGNRLAFVFAWARLSIIQTGSIALLSFIFGDYISKVYSLGEFSSVIYAAIAVIVLTAINCLGITFGSGTQKFLTSIEVLGILLIIGTGFFLPSGASVEVARHAAGPDNSSAGLAMVVVLLTFGGWNEAAYISAELKAGKKQLARALIISLILITIIYTLVNMAFLNVLGLDKMAGSEAVAVDLMQATLGQAGVLLIGLLVAVSALTSANATIFTGARTNYSMGRDFKSFSRLGKWNSESSVPINAFLVQGAISLALVSLGIFTRSGFETMLEYTAPVFWFFFLMTGISLFVLRKKEPHANRPFKVPLYPLTPLLFCLTSAYLLYSSIMYTGLGALVGIAVLLIGMLLIFFLKIKNKPPGN